MFNFDGALYLLCLAYFCGKIINFTNNLFFYFHAPNCSWIADNDVNEEDDTLDVPDVSIEAAVYREDPTDVNHDDLCCAQLTLKCGHGLCSHDFCVTKLQLLRSWLGHSVMLVSTSLTGSVTMVFSTDLVSGVWHVDMCTCLSPMTWSLVCPYIISSNWTFSEIIKTATFIVKSNCYFKLL